MIETSLAAHTEDTHHREDPNALLREPLASLGEELARMSAEIQSINSGFQAQVEQALTEARIASERGFQDRVREEVEKIRAEDFGKEESLRTEIERVLELLDGITQEIAEMIDDPKAELSTVMRMKAEEGVLRAYLNGLTFSLNGKGRQGRKQGE
jgi:hypothetical protein